MKIKLRLNLLIFTLLFAGLGFLFKYNYALAEAVFTNSFTEYTQTSNSYPNSTSSGLTNPIPDDAVIVELGYGSDDHDYYMGAAQGEFYNKGNGTWGVRSAGAKVALYGSERRGVMVTLNSDAAWNAPADTYLSRWAWASSNTSGGRNGGSDGNPANVCVVARYKIFNPVTHVIDNSQTYDSSNCPNYNIPADIRGWIRADDNKFFTNIGQFQFGNDAKLRGGLAYIRQMTSQSLDSNYVSDTVPRTELQPSSERQAVIRMKNKGTVSWIGDNITRILGDCDNFPIVEGPNPTPAGATCSETFQVSSNSYKLKKTSGSDSRLSAPSELSYSYTTTRVVSAVEIRNEICEYTLAPQSIWQKFVSWIIPKAFARRPGPVGPENCYFGDPEIVASVITAPKFSINTDEEVDFTISFTTQPTGGPANLEYKMVQKGNTDVDFGDLATIPVRIGPAGFPPQPISSNIVKGTLTRSQSDFSLQCSPTMIVVQLDSGGVPTSPVQFNVRARTTNGFDDTVNLSLSSSDPGLIPEFLTGSTVNPSHSAAQNPPNNRDARVTGTWTSGMRVISVTGLGLDGVTTANPPCDVYLDVRPVGVIVDTLTITPPDSTINKRSTQSYVVTAHFTNNTTQIVTDVSTCYSRNTSVATIPPGGSPCIATGVNIGTTQIYATYTDAGVTVTSNDAILRVIDIILPEAPDVTVNVNGACGTVTVNWSGPNSGPQPDHFQVYRSTSPVDSSFQPIGSPIEYSAPRIFVDGSPLSLERGNYYGVKSILGTEYSSLNKAGPIIPTPCAPNLDTSDKDLYRVNNKISTTAIACGISNPFILPNKTVFLTGSKVYFNINVCNSGNQRLTNLRVEESPSNTLKNITLENPPGSCSLRSGTGSGPYILNDLEAPPTGGTTVCTIQISATLAVPEVRDLGYSPIPSYLYRFFNKATIFSQQLPPKVVTTPPYLFSDTGAPVRNETAP